MRTFKRTFKGIFDMRLLSRFVVAGAIVAARAASARAQESVQYGPVAVGRELSRSWNDWQEHWTYLGFLSGEKGPIGSGPMRIKKSEWGGVFQPNPDGSISVGGYLGANIGVGRDVGTGGYMNLSWNGCK
jgi:hypothetical protein